MGCCSTRSNYEHIPEENLIIRFEDQLGYSKYNYRTICSKINNLNQNSCITEKELNLLTSFSISPHQFKDFFKKFETKTRPDRTKNYSFAKLHSLVLLLCNDPIEKKIKYLISLYECKGLLTKRKVDKMIKNLIKVSVEFILDSMYEIDKTNHILVEYRKSINKGKFILLESISNKLRNNEPSINIENFTNNCLVKFSELFNPSFLRYKSYLQGAKILSIENSEKLKKVKKYLTISTTQSIDLIPKVSKKSNSLQTFNHLKLFPVEKINKKENFRYQESRRTLTEFTEESENYLEQGENYEIIKLAKLEFLFSSESEADS